MGDCKITLYIPKGDENVECISLISISADASLFDLIQKIQSLFIEFNTNCCINLCIPGYTIQMTSSSPCSSSDITSTWTMAILDCTLYPPKDITSIIEKYNEPKGFNAMTLFSMGWYPSGELLLLLMNDTTGPDINHSYKKDFLEGRRRLFHDEVSSTSDTISNSNNNNKTNTCTIQRPLPSQLLLQATSSHRIMTNNNPINVKKADTVAIQQDDSQVFHSNHNRSMRNKTQNTHLTRVGSTLYTWDNEKQCLLPLSPPSFSPFAISSKKDQSKQQVLKMKIKSQCNTIYKNLVSKLRDEDRFYLETIVVLDSSTIQVSIESIIESRFMVFSRHATIAKVMSDILQDWNNILVPNTCIADIYKFQLQNEEEKDNNKSIDISSGHKKLPFLKRLYELDESKILSPFDMVYVWIHPSEDLMEGS